MNYLKHSGYCNKTELKDAKPQCYLKRTKGVGTAVLGGKNERNAEVNFILN